MIRRLILPLRRAQKTRTGALAFWAAVILGLGLGVLVGALASRSVYARARTLARNKAKEVGTELDRALEARRKALRLLAEMPSVAEHSPKAHQAFDALKDLYPEFSEVGWVTSVKPRSTSTASGPRPLRLVEGKPNQHIYGLLRSDWPARIMEDRALGRTERGMITILVGRRGSRTADVPSPLTSARVGLLAPGTVKLVPWSNGDDYLTSVWPIGTRSGLAIVSAYPMSYLQSQSGKAFVGGIVLGAVMGVFAGVVAWVSVSRSTRRLRSVNDVLERRVTERTAELAAAEGLFRGIFENVPLGLYHCDREGRFLRVNETLARTLGYATPDEMIATLVSLRSVGDLEARARFLDQIERESEVRDAITVTQTVDGRTIWLSERARAVRDGKGQILFIEGAMHDVTAQHELETQLRRIGETDALTGLLNRRGLTDAIAAAQAPVSFVTLDVDHFKAYNDTYGHPAGDRALQAVAAAIRGTVRESDAVARAGGEEFVVVLPRTGETGAKRVAEALRQAVESYDDLHARLTVSGGVATALTAEQVGEAFAAADRALYMAKEAGRNQIVVNGAKLA